LIQINHLVFIHGLNRQGGVKESSFAYICSIFSILADTYEGLLLLDAVGLLDDEEC
jgi:hypothetical protein